MAKAIRWQSTVELASVGRMVGVGVGNGVADTLTSISRPRADADGTVSVCAGFEQAEKMTTNIKDRIVNFFIVVIRLAILNERIFPLSDFLTTLTPIP